jgi:hypothetical protein
MPSNVLLDTCGRRRSPATLPSFHQGRPPRNKGQRYPADPPTVEEIIAVMRAAGHDADAVRLRGPNGRALACRPTYQRSARAERERPRSEPRRDLGPPRQRRQAPRGRDGPMGLGAAEPLAAAESHAAGRRAVLRASRSDARSPMGARQRPLAAAPRRRPSRSAASVRAPSAAPRSRWRCRAKGSRCS